ncbi:hypothetical protein ACP70R_027655 [Stipagrostis hirtigluma subsp. patula]
MAPPARPPVPGVRPVLSPPRPDARLSAPPMHGTRAVQDAPVAGGRGRAAAQPDWVSFRRSSS